MGNMRSFKRSKTLRIPESQKEMINERIRNLPSSRSTAFDVERLRARTHGNITPTGRDMDVLRRARRKEKVVKEPGDTEMRKFMGSRAQRAVGMRARSRVLKRLRRWTSKREG